MGSKKITIFDTTLRDGEQSPGCSMYLEEKISMARQLERLGVDVIEAGFPFASEGDFRSVAAIAEECRDVTVAGLCRTVPSDIYRAAEALKSATRPRIHTFVATSDIHLQYKLKKTRDEVLEMTAKAVRIARSCVDDVEFSAEDATRSDVDFLCEVFAVAVSEGATVLNVPDTVGYTLPGEFANLVRTVRERVVGDRDVAISVHCHNDLGLAVANSLAALEAGATQLECTVNGVGERAGNASLEELIMAIAVRGDKMPYTNNIDQTQLYPASQLLSSIVGFGVQPNKAIVGRNAFAHEAGIHQHGVLSNPLCYEIMTPESVGVPKNTIVLGKHSGRHALISRYAELGFTFDDVEIAEIYERFVALADRKKIVYDQDLLALKPSRFPVAIAA
ncbi:MAG: 2-isopropylmalate synthase [Pyrinomonadaceae bacterium]|nr:2-isopropylmalate synthase [Pyrinomonadaceae bacterium]MBP6212137.1 2-isopropylmalate synthase [Pyrinomonadaceae bacterium]